MPRTDTSSITAWTVALVLAAVLNLAIFGLMPGLQARRPMKEKMAPSARRINVIRLKQPERPVKKRQTPPPPPDKRKILSPGKSPAPPQAHFQKLDLPFAFNPRLPVHTGDLPLPPMAQGPPVAPGFKAEYAISELDRPLTPLVRVPPVYPLLAKHRGIEGWVRIRFRVSAQGNVEDIRIVEAVPKKIFDQSVIRCVSAWRFQPGTYQGRAVNTRVETTIRFELK